MTQGMKNTVKVLAVFLIVCCICAFAVLLVINPNNVFGFQEKSTGETSEGEKYIQALEAEPTGPIEEAIFSKRREEILQQFRDNPDRIWPTLVEYDLVFCGDSRGIGFTTEGYVDYAHNVSNYSRTIYNIPDYYETFKEMQPRMILICYGINDLGLYQWEGKEKYTEDLANFVYKLRELVPGVDV
jgi:hypothetical protein